MKTEFLIVRRLRITLSHDEVEAILNAIYCIERVEHTNDAYDKTFEILADIQEPLQEFHELNLEDGDES